MHLFKVIQPYKTAPFLFNPSRKGKRLVIKFNNLFDLRFAEKNNI